MQYPFVLLNTKKKNKFACQDLKSFVKLVTLSVIDYVKKEMSVLLRDVELKILKLGIYVEPVDFKLQSSPSYLNWSRYSGEALAASSWVQELSQLTGAEKLQEGILGASSVPGALAVSPDKELILKKLEAGDEVLATLFTLTYHFGEVGYLAENLGACPNLNAPLLGLSEQRGYPQLVRLKKVGSKPLQSEGMTPIKGITYEWAVSPLKRKGKALFLDEKIKRRFVEVADQLGVSIELTAKEEQALPFKKTDRVSNRKYQIEHYTYEIPSELDVTALWKVMDEQFAALDRKRVDLKTLSR